MTHTIPIPSHVAQVISQDDNFEEWIPWHHLDVRSWSQRTLSSEHSAEEGVRASIARIDELDPIYNAISFLLEEEALAAARDLDEQAAREGFTPGPLHGVPILVKDEVDVAGAPTTFGTNANPTPKTADSLIITRLREAGAIILGKTRMPAFGAIPFTESEAQGVTRNPYNPDYSPGGSSGGSAVATATGMVPVTIGGDGGGSIRIPSAHCGLTGLKPARGSVPCDPYDNLWLELGTAGPIARTVEDCSLVFDAISASTTHSELEAASASDQVGGEASGRKLVIGVNTKPSLPGLTVHKEHLRGVEKVVDALRKAGHTVKEVELKHPDPTAAFVTQFFGGIGDEIDGLEFPERIEARHKRTKLMGFWINDRVKQWAARESHKIGQALDGELEGLDALITPSIPVRPAKAGKSLTMGTLRSQIVSLPSIAFSSLWNVSGHAAMALPVGIAADGLPVGIQLVGGRGESDLLQVARIVTSSME